MSAESKSVEVTLRDVIDDDVLVFFAHMQDAEACHMAAFVPEDPSDLEAHVAHWSAIRKVPSIVTRTIVINGVVVGHVASFERAGDAEVTFWIDRAWWGRGVARAALAAFLEIDGRRPIHARTAADNIASRRVLEACAFTVIDEERGYAEARGEEIDELVLRRDD